MKPPNGRRFQPGESGNPGGKPKTAEVSALARRYTVDALRGLVGVARLEPSKHDSAVVAACRALLEWGFPGANKAGLSDGDTVNVLHMHLLAVQGAGAPVQLPTRPLPAPESADEDAGEDPIAENLLPQPDEAMPDEALPLWDVSRKVQH